MKNPILILALFLTLGFASVKAQSYYYVAEVGTSAPYFYDEAGTDILTSGNDVLSTWQSLPFAWTFFGLPVNGYYASDNGYVTFNQSETTSYSANTTVPAAGGPSNAIYAFWDDLTFGGKVRSWTIGLSPNRIHCVQWYQMTPTGGGTVTFTLRIYEGGDFDVVWDGGSSSGATATVGTEDAFNSAGNFVQSAPNTQFPNSTFDNNDDRVIEFIYGQQQTWDLSVQELNLSQTLAAGQHNVSGTIRNYGSSAVASLTVNYQLDNGPIQSSSGNTLTLTANGGSYAFNHSIPINLPTAGQFYTLRVWADNLNGNNDGNNTNDTLEIDLITVLGNSVPKSFLIEKVTGTWCGYCPAGDLGIDTAMAAYPGQIVVSSIHTGDAMDAGTDYQSFYKVSGVPTSWVDRSGQSFNSDPKIYPTGLKGDITSRINQIAPVGVQVFSQFDASTRQVSGTIVANFVDYALGDLRMVVLVTEDGIVADQANFFGGDPNHPYGNSPNPIPGYIHNHTLREIPLGEFGSSGIIPSVVNPNTSFSENFSFTVPTSWDVNELHMVGLVMNYSSDYRKQSVLNASENSFDNGVAAPASIEETRFVGVSPNPASGLGVARVEFAKATEASFDLYNAFGQHVQHLSHARYMPGAHHVYFDASTLAEGVYLLSVKTESGTLTKRVIVAH